MRTFWDKTSFPVSLGAQNNRAGARGSVFGQSKVVKREVFWCVTQWRMHWSSELDYECPERERGKGRESYCSLPIDLTIMRPLASVNSLGEMADRF